jgi:hypothetical protein
MPDRDALVELEVAQRDAGHLLELVEAVRRDGELVEVVVELLGLGRGVGDERADAGQDLHVVGIAAEPAPWP